MIDPTTMAALQQMGYVPPISVPQTNGLEGLTTTLGGEGAGGTPVNGNGISIPARLSPTGQSYYYTPQGQTPGLNTYAGNTSPLMNTPSMATTPMSPMDDSAGNPPPQTQQQKAGNAIKTLGQAMQQPVPLANTSQGALGIPQLGNTAFRALSDVRVKENIQDATADIRAFLNALSAGFRSQ